MSGSEDSEVREHDRRSDGLGLSRRIAGIGHPDHQGILQSLTNYHEYPNGLFKNLDWQPDRPPFPFPEDGRFEFLTKDFSSSVRERWGFLDRLLRGAEEAYEWTKAQSPEGVIVWNDFYPETRGMLLAARELKIPSIEIIHGHTHPIRPGDPGARDWADWKLGTRGYKFWHDYHRLPAKVLCTGSPSHDYYAGANLPALRLTARHELQIPEDATVITYLCDATYSRSAWTGEARTSGITLEFIKVFKLLRDVIPDLYLVIKMHPGEVGKIPLKAYKKILYECGVEENFTIMDAELVLALGAADVAVGVPTSAFADALMLEVPGVVLGYEPWFVEEPYRRRGFKVCRDHRDLFGLLTTLFLGKDEMNQILDDVTDGAWFFAGSVDGNASRRTLKALDCIFRGEEPYDCEYEGSTAIRRVPSALSLDSE